MQIIAYLSGSSPHIKSGAVSALSVLVYSDADICVSVPDLVPSVLTLLQSKDVEVTKVSMPIHDKILFYSLMLLISPILTCAGCSGICQSNGIEHSSKGPAHFALGHCQWSATLVICVTASF